MCRDVVARLDTLEQGNQRVCRRTRCSSARAGNHEQAAASLGYVHVSRARFSFHYSFSVQHGNRYTLINCRKQFPNTSHHLLKDILCLCLRDRAITGSLWEGVHALLVTLQQPELCLPLLHAMQPQDLVNLTLHPEYEKIMKPRLLQVRHVVLNILLNILLNIFA